MCLVLLVILLLFQLYYWKTQRQSFFLSVVNNDELNELGKIKKTWLIAHPPFAFSFFFLIKKRGWLKIELWVFQICKKLFFKLNIEYFWIKISEFLYVGKKWVNNKNNRVNWRLQIQIRKKYVLIFLICQYYKTLFFLKQKTKIWFDLIWFFFSCLKSGNSRKSSTKSKKSKNANNSQQTNASTNNGSVSNTSAASNVNQAGDQQFFFFFSFHIYFVSVFVSANNEIQTLFAYRFFFKMSKNDSRCCFVDQSRLFSIIEKKKICFFFFCKNVPFYIYIQFF